MGQEYTAKSFKSGNSVAIRMPAALGIKPDREWTIVERDGDLVIRAADAPKRKFNIAKVWGCGRGSWIEDVDLGDRTIQSRPLLWDDPEWRAKHMPDR
jgi:antitoxin VapB